MDNYPRMAPVAYLIALLLIVVPAFDSVMSVAPLHIGNAQWRFGASGLLANSLLLPVVGVLLAVAVSMTFEHEGVQKFLWVASWFLCIALLLSVVSFALDSLQTRSHIRPDIRTSFMVASVTAAFKLFSGAVIFALFGWAIPGTELFNVPEFRWRRS